MHRLLKLVASQGAFVVCRLLKVGVVCIGVLLENIFALTLKLLNDWFEASGCTGHATPPKFDKYVA